VLLRWQKIDALGLQIWICRTHKWKTGCNFHNCRTRKQRCPWVEFFRPDPTRQYLSGPATTHKTTKLRYFISLIINRTPISLANFEIYYAGVLDGTRLLSVYVPRSCWIHHTIHAYTSTCTYVCIYILVPVRIIFATHANPIADPTRPDPLDPRVDPTHGHLCSQMTDAVQLSQDAFQMQWTQKENCMTWNDEQKERRLRGHQLHNAMKSTIFNCHTHCSTHTDTYITIQFDGVRNETVQRPRCSVRCGQQCCVLQLWAVYLVHQMWFPAICDFAPCLLFTYPAIVRHALRLPFTVPAFLELRLQNSRSVSC
jgi:hypothetical protein